MQQDLTILAQLVRIWDWIENNRKQATYILVGVIIVACVSGYFLWSRSERQMDAGRALSQVVLTDTFKEKSSAELGQAYLKIASQYDGTDAAGYALLQAGTAEFEASNYDQAHKLFVRMIREYSSSPFMAQANLGIAACLDAEGKTDEAVQAYRNAIERYPESVIVPQAKFAIARIYESQGKLGDAYTLFEGLVQAEGLNTSIGSEAGMRGVELRQRMAAIIAATSAPPVTATSPLPSQGTNAP